MRLPLLLAAAALSLTACGNTEAAKPATAPSAPPKVSVQPAAVKTMTKEQAATRYLELVSPSNAAWSKLHDLQQTGGSLAVLKTKAKWLADNNRALMVKLRAEHWPKNVDRLIDNLVVEMAKHQPYLRAMARAEDRDTFDGVLDSYPMPEGNAEMVRQELGLGEVPAV